MSEATLPNPPRTAARAMGGGLWDGGGRGGMAGMTTTSHTRGETDVPLLEQTIPDNLDATVGRFGDRDALVQRSRGIGEPAGGLGDSR